MWKWINWAARTLATALLLSFLCIWTTGYIVNSYMESLVKQLDLPIQVQPFALSGTWGKLWGANPVASTGAAANKGAEASASARRPVSGTTSTASASPTISATPTKETAPAASDHPAVNGGGQTTAPPSSDASTSKPPAGQPPASPAPTGDNAAVPVFSNNAGILDMTDAQRKTLSTVMSKLNADQLSQLSTYLQDGLTDDELTKVDELIRPSLSQTEHDQMMDLLRSRTATTATPSGQPH